MQLSRTLIALDKTSAAAAKRLLKYSYQFESQEQIESTGDLLIQHHNAVVDCLEKRPGHYFPTLDRTVLLKGSSLAGAAWRRGYELAIALDPPPWRPMLNAEPQFLDRIFNNDTSVKNLIARDANLVFA